MIIKGICISEGLMIKGICISEGLMIRGIWARV